MRIEFFFDCSSPWTYLAFHNFVAMSEELSFQVEWKPILVGGVFNTVNPSVYANRDNPVPAKARYQTKDMMDWAAFSGIEINWPMTVFPVNSVKAMRGCIVAGEQGKLVPFARAVFEAYWGEDKNISRDDVLAEIAEVCGLDPAVMATRIADDDIKAELRANTEELVNRNGFGSPTIYLNGDDMYFGNDRLPLVRAKLTA
jgi:2-hydroxychromene-2-carboxylate isomerase